MDFKLFGSSASMQLIELRTDELLISTYNSATKMTEQKSVAKVYPVLYPQQIHTIESQNQIAEIKIDEHKPNGPS